jgi:hypothetical protein
VIGILGSILVAMIGFVWSEIRKASNDLTQFKEEQLKSAVKIRDDLLAVQREVGKANTSLDTVSSSLRKQEEQQAAKKLQGLRDAGE